MQSTLLVVPLCLLLLFSVLDADVVHVVAPWSSWWSSWWSYRQSVSHVALGHAATETYHVVPCGVPHTFQYRLYFRDSLGLVSPFHDIPLHPGGSEHHDRSFLNVVVEIPRWSNAKLEISNDEALNPVRHSLDSSGRLRYARNIFPFRGYMWNYGAFPQTWENANVADEVTGVVGDNDPLDVLEIGARVAQVGDVIQVKVLGALGLVDGGETDWKIFVVDVRDRLAPRLNDVCDIEEHFPGLIEASRNWLRTYKTPDGKAENQFALGGRVQDKEFALGVINRTHDHWLQLIGDERLETKHSRVSVTNVRSPFYVPRTSFIDVLAPPCPRPPSQDVPGQLGNDDDDDAAWYFVQRGDDRNCTAL